MDDIAALQKLPKLKHLDLSYNELRNFHDLKARDEPEPLSLHMNLNLSRAGRDTQS